MTTLTRPNRHRPRITLPPPTPPEPPRRRWGVLIFLVLAVGLVFCHGCHRGDHDDEPALMWLKARTTR